MLMMAEFSTSDAEGSLRIVGRARRDRAGRRASNMKHYGLDVLQLLETAPRTACEEEQLRLLAHELRSEIQHERERTRFPSASSGA